jgi:hypothetical protein
MDRSPEEELAKLGEKLRKTLSMMRAQSESMMTEDVNRGMSHRQPPELRRTPPAAIIIIIYSYRRDNKQAY